MEKGITEDFQRFGIAAQDFVGATSSLDKVKRFSDLIQGLSDEDRSLLEKVLGATSPGKFAPILKQGSEELLADMDEIIRTGVIMSTNNWSSPGTSAMPLGCSG